MAATRVVSGILREIWHELVPQAGGPPVVVVTGIRIAQQQLSRVRAIFTVDTQVGAAVPGVSAQVSAGGFLQFNVSNGQVGSTMTWTLDAMLTHSTQQATDPNAGAVITVLFGASAAAQTLAQTYDVGVAQDDQTMLVATAKGGGVIIDASTAVVTAGTNALNVRQSAAQFTPVDFSLRGNVNTPPYLYFTKARGTYAVPAAVASDDLLGAIIASGYTDAWRDLASITAYVTNVGAGPGFLARTSIDFAAAYDSSSSRVFRMQANPTGAGILELQGDGLITPAADNQGSIGNPVGNVWKTMASYTLFAQSNIHIADYVAHGAMHTLILANDSTLPAPTSNTVFIGSNDFVQGTNLAVLAVSAEEPAVALGVQVADTLIPIRYNGTSYYLLAYEPGGG